MAAKIKQISGIGLAIVGAFSLGYWQGIRSTDRESLLPLFEPNSTLNQGLESNKLDVETIQHAWLSQNRSIDGELTKDELAEKTSPNSDSGGVLEQNNYTLSFEDLSDPVELLEHLVFISSSEDPKHMEQFSSTIDKLRELVAGDPSNIETLIDYFVNAEPDSRHPYYITSVLQSADISNRETVLAELVERLTNEGSPQADQKMLQLVSNTGLVEKSKEVVDAVLNIALYAPSSDENKLFALDILMPYQLDINQKQKVVDDLRYALDTIESDDKSYLVESIMRYSDKTQRQDMANNFLQPNNDFSTRIAVLSSIHSASVQPSLKLKNQLLDIAKNPNDPLNEHAKHALMYAFEIDNREYQLLSDDSN